MPTLHDIIAARPNVYGFLRPTPLHHYAGLSDLLGAQVWVKHENHQPVGAFKVRGGLNYVAEGAGAAPLAAALQLKERLAGKKVVLVMSGGNLAVDTLRQILLDTR